MAEIEEIPIEAQDIPETTKHIQETAQEIQEHINSVTVADDIPKKGKGRPAGAKNKPKPKPAPALNESLMNWHPGPSIILMGASSTCNGRRKIVP